MIPKYLTLKDIEHINSHKYKSGGNSFLDNYMDIFWNESVKYIPKKLSPNYLTVGTTFFLLSGVTVAWLLDNTMKSDLPWWAYVYMTFTIFAAQTLDAIDGKHARITKQTSPVGQLLDHGADAFINCFQACMLCSTQRYGDSLLTLVTLVYIQSLFWVMNWEEHLTGVLRTQVDGLGGTEFQFIGMFMLICPVIDIYDIRNYKLPYSNISLIETLFYLSILSGLFNMLFKITKNVLLSLEGDKRKKAINLMISPLLIIVSELAFYNSEVFALYTIEMCVLGGLIFGFYMCKVIVSTMAKKEMELINFESLVFIFVQFICFFVLKTTNEQVILYKLFALIVGLRYCIYVFAVIKQLLDVLNIKF